MSASFYDLMKYAKTGIASPDMTGFDKVRALSAFPNDYPLTTLTGIPPIDFLSKKVQNLVWTLLGNERQTGTPTPDAPITPQECGDLVGIGEHTGQYAIPLSLSPTPIYLDEPIRRIGNYADTVSSDGTVTRRVKKLVLTGTENWTKFGDFYYIENLTNTVTGNGYCTHYVYNRSGSNLSCAVYSSSQLRVYDNAFADKDAFKSYLAAQYAAGTPVTVWYVIATPTTQTIPAPTLTTAKGSNVLTVDTTLQPSSVSITGNIIAT